MADTYTLISSVTVGAGGASSIDFTSIPATYTDLLIQGSLRTDQAASFSYSYMKFNNNASSYSSKWLYGTGAAAGSTGFSTAQVMDIDAANNTASTFTNFAIYVPNYAGSTNKSYSIDSAMEQNGTTAYAELIAGLWSNTSAINQVTFTLDSTYKYAQYSTVYLYGIKNS